MILREKLTQLHVSHQGLSALTVQRYNKYCTYARKMREKMIRM